MDLIRKYVREKTWTVLPTEVKLNLSITDKGGVLGAALAARKKLQSSLMERKLTTTVSKTERSSDSLVGLTNNSYSSWFGYGILASSVALFLVTRGKPSTSSSITPYLRDVLLIGQAGLGLVMALQTLGSSK